MICAPCFDAGHGEIDMVHMEDIESFADPGAHDGYGERKVCWHECPKCCHQEECDKGHSTFEE